MNPEDELPHLCGLYRGVVLDNRDPEGRRRLLVKVPAVNGDGELGWALPCFPLLTQRPTLEASADRYMVVGRTEPITVRLPEPGAPLWVMFENGDPTAPVYLGSWIGV